MVLDWTASDSRGIIYMGATVLRSFKLPDEGSLLVLASGLKTTLFSFSSLTSIFTFLLGYLTEADCTKNCELSLGHTGRFKAAFFLGVCSGSWEFELAALTVVCDSASTLSKAVTDLYCWSIVNGLPLLCVLGSLTLNFLFKAL